jgi:hypothetical protein
MTVRVQFRPGLNLLSAGCFQAGSLPVLDREVVGKSILTTVPFAFKLRTGTQAAVTTQFPKERGVHD